MDVFNRLRSTVSQAVSQVTVSLPGNPVTREYDTGQQIASAGPGLLWKVFSAVKKSSREPAAVFLFEKRVLDRWSRPDRDRMLELLRHGVCQLTKLRHPIVLTVQHPLEESRESLAFATEPVFASLADILDRNDNQCSVTPSDLAQYTLDDIEVKYGLYQIGVCLSFIHERADMVHGSVCPSSVIINRCGAWKLFAFEFSIAKADCTEQTRSMPKYSVDSHACTQPSLEIMAPELADGGALSPASDVFSLGCLVFAVFNRGQPLFRCHSDWRQYKRLMSELKHTVLAGWQVLKPIPEPLRESVSHLLTYQPSQRPSALQFTEVRYFDDPGVRTLNYLDTLFDWDNRQKSHFYKSLPQHMSQFPHRVCLHRVVPLLSKEFINPAMVPFVLPTVFAVAEKATNDEFMRHIWPHLVSVVHLTEPIQVLLSLVANCNLLLERCTTEAVREHIVPLVCRALTTSTSSSASSVAVCQLHETSLKVVQQSVPLFQQHHSASAVTTLLPAIKRLCLSAGDLSVRVGCLVSIGRLLPLMQRHEAVELVLPLLPQVSANQPATIMAILGIYKVIMATDSLCLSKEVLATQALPFLIGLSVDSSLSVSQYDNCTRLIRDMMDRVEKQHRTKLAQLDQHRDKQQQLLSSSVSLSPVSESKSSSNHSDGEMFFGSGSVLTPMSMGVSRSADIRHSTVVPGPVTLSTAASSSVIAADSLISSNLAHITSGAPLSRQCDALPLGGGPSSSPIYRPPILASSVQHVGQVCPATRPDFGTICNTWAQSNQTFNINSPPNQPCLNVMPIHHNGAMNFTNPRPAAKPLSSSEINDLLS